ncbi:MAG: hypothetical protein IKZ07_09110 [Akkermansia sp.]|nr:hypothetical protein [Akkermansia sp.]
MERSRLVTGGVSIYGACLATGRILCRPSYSFPTSISPIDSTAIYDKSLYEAEESANKFETELIQAITGYTCIGTFYYCSQAAASKILSTLYKNCILSSEKAHFRELISQYPDFRAPGFAAELAQ